MAYAAYRESTTANLPEINRPACRGWMVLDVMVASLDAYLVRKAIAACRGAGILRCVPELNEHRVRLKIRFDAGLAEEVMHFIMTSVPGGEIGHVCSWREHVQRHGLGHAL